MALGIGYGLPFVAQHGSNPYKTQWAAAQEGAKAAGATVEDENAGVGSCLVSRGQEAYTAGLPGTPSLLIVPQFYKAGNLYQDVPPFVAEDSTMRFTVTRDTTARRVNSSGLIESVASGVPRIDWLGQSCPALLVEPSAQNLALQSEAFNVSGTWGPQNSAQVSANVSATLDPAGGNNADLIFCQASGTAAQGFNQNVAVSVSGTYTMSVFVKKAVNFDWFRMQFTDAASNVNQAYFNLVSGTIGTVSSGSTATITNYGNGWYRVTHSRSTASGTLSIGLRLASADNTTTVDADGNSGTYAWGAQLETGSVATTYIPTTSGSVTRNADQITASGALVSGLIGATEGTIYAEVDVRNSILGAIIVIDDGDTTDFISIVKNANLTIRVSIRRANGTIVNIITSSAVALGVHKIALGYTNGDYALYIDGVSAGTSTNSTNYPATALTQCVLSNTSYGPFNDRIRAAALYTTRLDNATLEQLTKL